MRRARAYNYHMPTGIMKRQRLLGWWTQNPATPPGKRGRQDGSRRTEGVAGKITGGDLTGGLRD